MIARGPAEPWPWWESFDAWQWIGLAILGWFVIAYVVGVLRIVLREIPRGLAGHQRDRRRAREMRPGAPARVVPAPWWKVIRWVLLMLLTAVLWPAVVIVNAAGPMLEGRE